MELSESLRPICLPDERVPNVIQDTRRHLPDDEDTTTDVFVTSSHPSTEPTRWAKMTVAPAWECNRNPVAEHAWANKLPNARTFCAWFYSCEDVSHDMGGPVVAQVSVSGVRRAYIVGLRRVGQLYCIIGASYETVIDIRNYIDFIRSNVQ